MDDNKKSKIFGERLRYLRKKSKLTQQQLADVIGLSAPAIYSYENGTKEPSITNLNKLADYFGVSVDFLLCRQDELKTLTKEDLPEELKSLGIDSIKINKLSSQELQQELTDLTNYADKIKNILKKLGK